MVFVPLVSGPTALTNIFLFLSLIQRTTKTSALVLYDDGSSHCVTDNINDAVNLRSSSSLQFSGNHYVIRAPKGSESAVRLYMSSSLNMTNGEIIGGDIDDDSHADGKDTWIGAGVVVGSASQAEFHEGATVRGGSHVGKLMTADGQLTSFEQETNNLQSGKGGDALVGLYFSSTITIRGGNFIGGRGSSSYGHSLHVAYEAQANVYGGSFQGSFLARDQGVIVVHGCVSRVGNRLVGHLDNGDSVDIELVEEGGKVIVQEPKFAQACSKYHRTSSSGKIGTGLFFGILWIGWCVMYFSK